MNIVTYCSRLFTFRRLPTLRSLTRNICGTNRLCPGLLLLCVMAMPAQVFAKPDVKIHIEALKQVIVEENGKKVVKRVPAKEAKPGDTVIFQLHYHNEGDQPAINAALVDPIPMETMYIKDSAFGAGSTITFSADEGKTYASPDKLVRTIKKADGTVETKLIPPRFYTHIRWLIKEIPPGKGGVCTFQVELK